MSLQAAVLRIVIRLLVAAAVYALAIRAARGADQTQPLAMLHLAKCTPALAGFEKFDENETVTGCTSQEIRRYDPVNRARRVNRPR